MSVTKSFTKSVTKSVTNCGAKRGTDDGYKKCLLIFLFQDISIVSVFFFPVKPKSARETTFSEFCHGQFIGFTVTFSKIVTGNLLYSRVPKIKGSFISELFSDTFFHGHFFLKMTRAVY